MTGTKHPWVLAVTSVASLMVALDLLAVATSLDSMRRSLGSSVASLQWTVTAYGLAFACLLLAGAALGDRYGRRRIFVLGLLVFASASGLCALSPTLGWLVAARTLQGAGAAMVLPLSVTLLSESVRADRRARALGLFEGITGFATLAGPLVGGVLSHTLGWEWIFWINVPICALLVPVALRAVPESRGSDTVLDGWGMLLATCAAFTTVWVLVRANTVGWLSPQVLLGAVAALVSAWGFVASQRRHRRPMVPPGLFQSRAFSAGTLTSFLGFASLYGSVFYLSQFLQVGLGYSPLEAGVRMTPWTGTLLVVAPLAGMIAERVGNRPVLVTGLLLQSAGFAWVATTASAGMGYLGAAVPLVTAGIGSAAAIPVVQSVVLNGVSHGWLGKASGVNNATQELGGALGVAVMVTLFGFSGSYATPGEFVSGFRAAMGGCAVFGVAAVLAALLVPAALRADPTRADSGRRVPT